MRYIAAMPTAEAKNTPPRTRLPDFCALPTLFALLLLAALVVVVMLLAPGSTMSIRGLTVAMSFAVWLAIASGVSLCKSRPALERLPTGPAYLAVWLVLVLVVFVGSTVVWWVDHRLQTGLVPDGAPRFMLGNTLIAALVSAALLRYFYVLAQWQDRLRAVSQAKLEALQARIRPHFLFNSMNTVAALVRLDPAAAETTIENLSELFRAALGAEDRPGTLGEELDLIDRYLDIEQLRLGERLRVERDLADAPRELHLPRLLLQPLVENAVYHGVQTCNDGGVIGLSTHCGADMLQLVVTNPCGPDGLSSHQGHGHALTNVRHRIGYYYGDRAQLETRKEDGVYRVTVKIPLSEYGR